MFHAAKVSVRDKKKNHPLLSSQKTVKLRTELFKTGLK